MIRANFQQGMESEQHEQQWLQNTGSFMHQQR